MTRCSIRDRKEIPMTKSQGWIAALCVLVIACGEGNGKSTEETIDYLSQPPAEAAAQLAERECEALSDCGFYRIECSPGPPSASYIETTRQECLDDLMA